MSLPSSTRSSLIANTPEETLNKVVQKLSWVIHHLESTAMHPSLPVKPRLVREQLRTCYEMLDALNVVHMEIKQLRGVRQLLEDIADMPLEDDLPDTLH